MSQSFHSKKQHIIENLSVADKVYTDASPKGSVDEGIRELVGEINRADGFVTTSSCSGRVVLFLEGQRKPNKIKEQPQPKGEEPMPSVNAGGKGGGRWLFTSHQPIDLTALTRPGAVFDYLGFPSDATLSFPHASERPQYVHFKFEPMILHILSQTSEKAQTALNAAMTAGFRESGISSVFDAKGQPTDPLVAVRSSGLAMDSLVAFVSSDGENPVVQPMVSEAYLRTLFQVANERFEMNMQRTERFRQAFIRVSSRSRLLPPTSDDTSNSWESPVVRKARMRAEGLRMKQAVLASRKIEESNGTWSANASNGNDSHAHYGLDMLESGPIDTSSRIADNSNDERS